MFERIWEAFDQFIASSEYISVFSLIIFTLLIQKTPKKFLYSNILIGIQVDSTLTLHYSKF